jgi:hypothetical protein
MHLISREINLSSLLYFSKLKLFDKIHPSAVAKEKVIIPKKAVEIISGHILYI